MAGELSPESELPPPGRKTWKQRLRQITAFEWLVMAAIVGVLVVLLYPAPQWVADGEINALIEVTVFDAQSLQPVDGARVTVVRATPGTGEYPVAEFSGELSPTVLNDPDFSAVTGPDGIARVTRQFHTVASNRNPVTRALVGGHWILVAREGFGTVAIPLRTEPVPIKQIREQGKISAMVPLYRIQSANLGD